MSNALEQLSTWLVNGYGFQAEVPFRGVSGKRKFRFDFGLPDRKIGVDYHGFGAGAAHTFREKKATDHEKVSEAALEGWVYIICDAVSVRNGKCGQYIDAALARRNAA